MIYAQPVNGPINNGEPVIQAQPVNAMSNDAYESFCEQENCYQAEQEAPKTFEDILNQFDDENDSEEAKEAKGVFKKFLNYVSSNAFKEDVEETAEKYHVPPKQLAKNFLTKSLGILGDVLGIVFTTAGNIMNTIVNVISVIAHGAVDVIVRAGKALAGLVSLNQTNNACAAA